MKGVRRPSGPTLAIGIGLLVVVGIGAGVGGYELGLRASRYGALTSSNLLGTATPRLGSPTPSPVAPPPSGTPTPAESGNVPSPRSNASWVYDSAVGKFLLYGGSTTTGNYNEFPQALADTWTWGGTTWARVTSVAPSARFSAPAVYDESRRVVLLHAGVTGTAIQADTWTWDGTRWLQMGPSQAPPASGAIEPMAFDPSRGVTVLVVLPFMTMQPTPIQTWTWDGTNWTQVPTTAQPTGYMTFAALAYDPGQKKVVYFGHMQNGQPETWTFDGANWTHMPTTSGATSQNFAMARDDASGNVVLFGSNGDTWTWDGTKWSPANPVHSPGPRQNMAVTYDPVHRTVVLFGGDSGQAAGLQHHNDVWSWGGTDWAQVSGS